uniref:Uncharacterized protein n=1 Tax=Plectus sambesii TaxID=2011161 RepID=A0A914XTR6_9BILA
MSDAEDDSSSGDETSSTPDAPIRIFVPDENDKTPRYDKVTMLQLATSTLSTTRPDILSVEFNNDVGLWSPELWLEWKWATEGAETRGAAARRKHREVDKLKAEHPTLDGAQGETVVLSPQRRGFVGGCRPTSPKPTEQSEHRSERIGADRRDWRSGAAGFGSKQQASNERDFKPPFQKLAASSGGGSSASAVPSSSAYGQRSMRGGSGGNGPSSNSSWRDAPRGPGGDSSNANSYHSSFNRDRDNRYGQQQQQQQRRPWNNNYDRRSEERMPEWMDEGPETILDVIELKGFDDDPNTVGGPRQNGQGKENYPQSARNNLTKRGGATADRKDVPPGRGGGQQQQQQQQQVHQQHQQQQRGNGRGNAAGPTKDAKGTTNGSR